MKYLILIIIALSLTGCPAVEKYKAEQEQAHAAQQAAIADQMAQQARMVESDNQAAMMDTLADAAKPVYWPFVVIVAIFAVALLLFMRMHVIAVSHVAAGEPVRELRMLPSAKPFGELRLEARRQGYELAVKGDSYYLVDKQGQFQRITGLIEQIERGDV